jgi:hypothetical protein
LGTDFEKAHPSAAVSRIDGAGFPVNVRLWECRFIRISPSRDVNSDPNAYIRPQDSNASEPRNLQLCSASVPTAPVYNASGALSGAFNDKASINRHSAIVVASQRLHLTISPRNACRSASFRSISAMCSTAISSTASHDPRGSCDAVDEMAVLHIAEIDRKLADLQALRGEIVKWSRCDATTIAECRLIDALSLKAPESAPLAL